MAKLRAVDGNTYKFIGVPREVPAPTDEDPDAVKVVRDPLGIDANALFPDEIVKVRESVAAGETGAHNDREDAVVVEWEVPDRVRTEDGWGHGTATRALAVSVQQFTDLFEEA